jgi:hypothetical protein
MGAGDALLAARRGWLVTGGSAAGGGEGPAVGRACVCGCLFVCVFARGVSIHTFVGLSAWGGGALDLMGRPPFDLLITALEPCERVLI